MERGCNIGNSIVLGPTGTYPIITAPNNELYNGDQVAINASLECGPGSSPYNFVGHTQCMGQVGNTLRYGNVIEFASCPIDSTYYILAISIFLFLVVKKQLINI